MDSSLQQSFIKKWRKYFAGAELPITYYYRDRVDEGDLKASISEYRCLIGNLRRVREGHVFVYSRQVSGCSGGKRYSGFSTRLRPEFEYFLSCGIPGKVEGERYKKSPELVQEFVKMIPPFTAPGKFLIFKRWDKLQQDEEPLVVVFFATADVLSGLFTLVNFDASDLHGVITPMGSGCGTVIHYPLLEAEKERSRAVLGMFDVSARPDVPAGDLTLAIPFRRFRQMIENMDESFLITESWQKVKKRIPSNL